MTLSEVLRHYRMHALVGHNAIDIGNNEYFVAVEQISLRRLYSGKVDIAITCLFISWSLEWNQERDVPGRSARTTPVLST